MAPTKSDLEVMVPDLQAQIEELNKKLEARDHLIQELQVASLKQQEKGKEAGLAKAHGSRIPTGDPGSTNVALRREVTLGTLDRFPSPSLDREVTEAARAATAKTQGADTNEAFKLNWVNFVFKPAKENYLKGASNWRTYESLLLTALVLTGFDEANAHEISAADRVKLALHIGQTMQAEPLALVEGMSDGVEMLQALRGAYGGADMARGQKAMEDLTRLRYDGGCPFKHIAEFRRLMRIAATADTNFDDVMKTTLFFLTTRERAFHWTTLTEKLARWEKVSTERILDDFAQEFRYREGKEAEASKRHDQARNSTYKFKQTGRAYLSEAKTVKTEQKEEGPASEPRKKKPGLRGSRHTKDVTCFNCNKKGHISRNCPEKAANKRERETNMTSFHAAANDIMGDLSSFPVATDKAMLATVEKTVNQKLAIRSLTAKTQTLTKHVQTDENSRQIFDTGADVHITNSMSDFISGTVVEITNSHLKVMTGAGPVFPSHAGIAKYDYEGANGEKQSVTLKMTLYVKDFPVKIFSGERFYEAGGTISDNKLINRKGGIITTLNPRRRGFELWPYGKPEPMKPTKQIEANPSLAAPDTQAPTTASADKPQKEANQDREELTRKLTLWHRRLCHPSHERLLRTIKLTTGIDIPPEATKSLPCWACDVSKIRRIDSHDQREPASHVGEVTNIDLGEIKPISIDGHKIFCLIVDSFSRFQTLETFPTKDKVWTYVEAYLLRVIGQLKSATNGQHSMKVIQVDGGTEISTSNMTKFVSAHGIILRVSSPDNQYQNGISERRIGVIQDAAAAVAYQNKIPTCFWNYIVKAIVFVTNRIATLPVKGATPLEVYRKALEPNKAATVDNSILRILGSRCAALIDKTHRDRAEKLNPRGADAIFLGYQGEHNYVVWLLEGQRILITPHVIFHESIGDYGELSDPKDVVRSLPQHVQRRLRHRVKTRSYVRAKDNNIVSEDKTDDEGEVRPRRGRPRKTRVELYLLEAPADHDEIQEALKKEEEHDRAAHFASKENHSFMSATATTTDNPTLKDALRGANREDWIKAMFHEIDENLRRGTFDFKLRSSFPNARYIDSKWVLKLKRHPDGKIDKFKARICARGFTQEYGIDYTETFASTARAATWRILLALAAVKEWHVRQIDFVAAYLNGDLQETIVMQQFPGLRTFFATYPDAAQLYGYTPDSVILLKKPLYGLKQSGAEWQKKIRGILAMCGFYPLTADNATYYSSVTGDIITTHVDDFLLFGPSEKRLRDTANKMSVHVPVQDLGDAKWFLKVAIERTSPTGAIELSQAEYHQRIVEEEADVPVRHAMTPCNPQKFELAVPADATTDELKRTYASTIGKLIYSACTTRPDIAFATNTWARFMSCPSHDQLMQVRRIIQYLRETPARGITYCKMKDHAHAKYNELGLFGAVDSSYASCPHTARSTTGYVFFMAGAPVTWISHIQKVVARGTTEAEYIACNSAASEAAWIRTLLEELKVMPPGPITILEDNTGTLAWLKPNQPNMSKQKRHVRVAYHYVMQEVNAGHIRFQHVRSEDNPADGLTKPLGAAAHKEFVRMINMME